MRDESTSMQPAATGEGWGGGLTGLVGRLGQVPGSSFGILGLAFALCSLEVHRYPVVHLVSGEFSTVNMVVVVATLALVALLSIRGHGGLVTRPGFLLGASVFGSLCLYASFDNGVGGSAGPGFAGLSLFLFSAVGFLSSQAGWRCSTAGTASTQPSYS